MADPQAVKAVAVALSYLQEVRDEFQRDDWTVGQIEDALQTLALAAKQLDTAAKLDPIATSTTTDRFGNEGQPTQDQIRAELLSRQGLLEHMFGRDKKAIQHIEKALTYDPDNASIYAALAAPYQAIGDKKRALQAARRAAELDPDAIDYAKEADRIAGTSKAALRVSTFKGSYKLIFFWLGIFGLMMAKTYTAYMEGTLPSANTTFALMAILWLAPPYLYWRWRRGYRV